MRIYLAGPVSGFSYTRATAWRGEAKIKLPGFQFLDPMKGQEDKAHIEDLPVSYNDRHIHGQIVRGDLLRVDSCDIVLANFLGATKASMGTIFEMGYAAKSHKLIVCVMEKDNIHRYAFIEENSVIFEDLDVAIDYIRKLQAD